MFDDWDLLLWIDEDVQAAGAHWGISLPAWPTKPLKPEQPREPEQNDYPDAHAYEQARQTYLAALAESEDALKTYKDELRAYQAAVTAVGIARKEAIEQISRLEKPGSWVGLAERLWADPWLDDFIRAQVPCRAARDELTREAIVAGTKERLYYVILSNAGKWYLEGDYQRDWRGFVIRQVPQLAQRSAADENPPDREQPRGDGGPDDEPDRGSPLNYLGQSRELAPDTQAELREMVELVESELSELERRLFGMLYFEAPRVDADVASEWGIARDSLKTLRLGLVRKLKRAFGVTPKPKRKTS